MDTQSGKTPSKLSWWPLFSRHKARRGESFIGWLDDLKERRVEARALQPAPEPRAAPATLKEPPEPATPRALLPEPKPTAPSARAPAPQPQEEAPPSVQAEPTPKPSPAREEPAPPIATQAPLVAAPAKRESLFDRMKRGLSRSAETLTGGITQIFTTRKIDEATLQELEDLLIGADLGTAAAGRLTEALRKGRIESGASGDAIKALLAAEVERVLTPAQVPLSIDAAHKPHVVLVVGVNGTGKTTTIGKLAHKLKSDGMSVMLAAGDTFRAAAIDQLKVWGERVGAEVISREVGADAAGLAFDALEKAKAAGIDVLLIDTAGRLQNKAGLMAELEKIIRVIKKLDPAAPHSVIQVLDATTGQNAIGQVEAFHKVAGVTGLVMTKLDGTARGGILVPLTERFGLPIHAIGVGEAIDDLQPFDAALFARALAGLNEAG